MVSGLKKEPKKKEKLVQIEITLETEIFLQDLMLKI